MYHFLILKKKKQYGQKRWRKKYLILGGSSDYSQKCTKNLMKKEYINNIMQYEKY